MSQFRESLASQNLDLSWYVHICCDLCCFLQAEEQLPISRNADLTTLRTACSPRLKLQEVLESQEFPCGKGRCALRAGSRWRGPRFCGSSFSEIPNAILEFLLKLEDAEDKLDEDDEDAEKKEDIAEGIGSACSFLINWCLKLVVRKQIYRWWS